MLKKLLVILCAAMIFTGCTATPAPVECVQKTDAELLAEGYTKVVALPAARDTTKKYTPSKDAAEVACEANTYNAACSSISVANLTEFVGRNDVVYIDLRDYSDYGTKHLKGFESIPFFGLIYNKAVGTDATLNQLFGGENGAFVDNYKESNDLLEAFIPKDKTVFLMCQSGGRVVTMMQILEAKGYDMSKIYNVGGMGQYTDKSFAALTTNTEEVVVEATYNFNGLTKN